MLFAFVSTLSWWSYGYLLLSSPKVYSPRHGNQVVLGRGLYFMKVWGFNDAARGR